MQVELEDILWLLRTLGSGGLSENNGDLMSNFGSVTLVDTGVASYAEGEI